MAALNPKLLGPAAQPTWQQATSQRPLLVEVKTVRAWPLSSLAHSVRNTTAVVIDAVMGRYDR